MAATAGSRIGLLLSFQVLLLREPLSVLLVLDRVVELVGREHLQSAISSNLVEIKLIASRNHSIGSCSLN